MFKEEEKHRINGLNLRNLFSFHFSNKYFMRIFAPTFYENVLKTHKTVHISTVPKRSEGFYEMFTKRTENIILLAGNAILVLLPTFLCGGIL